MHQAFYYNMRKCYYEVFRNAAILLQNPTVITKYVSTDVITFYCADVLFHKCYIANHENIRFVMNRIRVIM